MRLTAAGLAALALLLSGPASDAHEVTAGGITVAHPWMRATPGGATNGVAYLEIKADAGVQDRLLSASTPIAARAELHSHMMDGDVMRMRRLDDIAVLPGGSILLEPHGAHIMLMDLNAPLKEGDLVRLTLTFEQAGPIAVDATVEPIGATGPHGLDHPPGHAH